MAGGAPRAQSATHTSSQVDLQQRVVRHHEHHRRQRRAAPRATPPELGRVRAQQQPRGASALAVSVDDRRARLGRPAVGASVDADSADATASAAATSATGRPLPPPRPPPSLPPFFLRAMAAVGSLMNSSSSCAAVACGVLRLLRPRAASDARRAARVTTKAAGSQTSRARCPPPSNASHACSGCRTPPGWRAADGDHRRSCGRMATPSWRATGEQQQQPRLQRARLGPRRHRAQSALPASAACIAPSIAMSRTSAASRKQRIEQLVFDGHVDVEDIAERRDGEDLEGERREGGEEARGDGGHSMLWNCEKACNTWK